eukprot:4174670-Amphidinium_carterae.1
MTFGSCYYFAPEAPEVDSFRPGPKSDHSWATALIRTSLQRRQEAQLVRDQLNHCLGKNTPTLSAYGKSKSGASLLCTLVTWVCDLQQDVSVNIVSTSRTRCSSHVFRVDAQDRCQESFADR